MKTRRVRRVAPRLASLSCLLVGLLAGAPLRADDGQPAPPAEDPLPSGAIARLGTLRWRHGEGVSDLALSPDGQRVACVAGGALSLFDARGQRLACFELPAEEGWELTCLAWAPDGRTVALGSLDGQVVLMDPASGERRAVFSHEGVEPHHLGYAPDGGTLVSLDEGGVLRLWEPTGALRCRIAPPEGVYTWAWSPDGKRLAIGDPRGLSFADPRSGLLTPPPDAGQGEEPIPVEVLLWSAGQPGPIGASAERLLFFGPDGALQRQLIPRAEEYLLGLSLSPDKQTLAVACEQQVGLLDLGSGEVRAWVKVDNPQRLVFTGDGARLLVATGEPALAVIDPAAGTRSGDRAHDLPISELGWDPSGKRLLSVDPSQVLVWSWPERKVARLLPPERGVVGIALAPDGTCALSALDGLTLIGPDGQPRGKLGSEEAIPVWVAFSPDGKRLAAASSDGSLGIWDAPALTLRHALLRADEEVTLGALAWSRDGQRLAAVSARDERTVDLWELGGEKPRRVRSFPGAASEVEALAFTPDGGQLVIVGGDARLLAVETGELVRAFDPQAEALGMALSPDGQTLALVHERRVSLWGTADGQLRRVLEGHLGPVTCAGFSPDGQLLATGSADTTVLIWRLP